MTPSLQGLTSARKAIRAALGRLGRSGATRTAAAVLVLAGLAVVATFTQARGEIVADARYEHVAAPGQFLERHASVWDDQRTLGEPTKYFSPVVGTFQAVLEKGGAAPWVIQRSTHALLLFAAAAGAYLVARELLDHRVGWFVAAFAFAFNAYTTQFLIPSGLFTAYALAPWMAFTAMRGVRSRDPWRWAAGFAVIVFTMGMLNTSSLLLGMLPAAGLVVLALVAREVDWRAVLAWCWRTLVLTVGASAAMLVTLGLTGQTIRFNLQTTETPRTVAGSTAAGESWRGLGQWLSYFRSGQRQLRDQSSAYFTDVPVILATFAVVLLAAVGLVLARRRAVAGLGFLAAISVIVMVGIYPIGDPTPFGRLLEEGFDGSLFIRSFRSTYKAGAGLQLPVALLAAAAVVVAATGRSSAERTARRRVANLGRVAAVLVAVAAIGVGSYPYWTGNLYPSQGRHDAPPDYWDDAFAWFEAQPSEPGVLVLPSLARTPYRWGFINDTLFDARLPQPAVSARTLPQSTAALADVTEWIEEYTGSSAARPGALGPILRRLGVRWVLLQNDVDWLAAGVPRPLTYDMIRDDPAFELAASFGRPGLNVVGRITFDRTGVDEARLPPIEVYELVDDRPPGGVLSSNPVVVSGGGEVWPTLGAAGWLDAPVVYRGDLDATTLGPVLAAADAFVMTDGGQRRAVRVAGSQSQRSPVLGIDDDLGRPVQTLFDSPSDQTIATYGDVTRFSASRFGRLFGLWDAAFRPSNTMDENPLTAWATDSSIGQTVVVELRSVTAMREITVDIWGDEDPAPVGDMVVVGARAGQEVLRLEHTFGDDEATATFAVDDDLDRVAVTITRADEAPGLVGIAELALVSADGPLDGRELLRVPGPADDREADELTAALGATDVHHVFSRVVREDSHPEHALINREFWSPGGAVTVTAHVRVDESTPDAVIDRLISSPVSAVGSHRFVGEVTASGRNAVDGNFATAWQFEPGRPAELAVSLPAARANAVEVWLVVRGGSLPFPLSRLTAFDLHLGDSDGNEETTRVELDPDEPSCDSAFAALGDDICVERVTVEFDERSISTLRLEAVEVAEAPGTISQVPVQLADVRLRLDDVDLLENAVEATDECRPLFGLDDDPVAFRPVEAVTLDSLAAGIDFVSCDPVSLTAGVHRIRGTVDSSFAVETLMLAPQGAPGPTGEERAIEAERLSATHRTFRVTVVAGDIVVTNVPDHRGWRVSAEGVDGRRLSADGFVAWQATGDGPVVLDLRFAPQRLYRLAWMLTAATLAVCVWLLIPGRRRHDG